MLAGRVDPGSLRYTYNHDGFQGFHERPDQPASARAVVKTHARLDTLTERFPRFLTQQAFCRSDPRILIVRDPRDVAVSLFFYRYFRMPRVKNRWHARLPYTLRYPLMHGLFFGRVASAVAEEWSEFNEEWLKLDPILVRYRDLLDDAMGTLREVMEALATPFMAEYARQAVEYCRFGSLRQREDRKFSPGAQNERFFRSGKRGSWQAHFSLRLLNEFDRLTGDLPARLGLQ